MQKQCAQCGGAFDTSHARVECCSRGCALRLRAKRHGPTNWKGGVTKHSSGYRKQLAKGHPKADQWGYVMQHRLVVEQQLGRFLHGTERVHHKNGVRSDNRPENLEVWVLGAKDPQGARTRDLWREIERRLSDTPTKNEVREAFEQVFGFGNRSQQSASTQHPYAGHSIAALPGRDRATEEQRRVAATPTGWGSHRHQEPETD